MNSRERVAKFDMLKLSMAQLREVEAQAIDAAVVEEREACAKIAENYKHENLGTAYLTTFNIAAAIRNRSEQPS